MRRSARSSPRSAAPSVPPGTASTTRRSRSWSAGSSARAGFTVALAESCTGGLVGHRLTQVAGSSAYFERGFVVYSNEAKQALLGVPEAVLREHGAVSAACAEAMARGARERAGTDVGVSVTGIAGPDGGTPTKPVGTVFVGLADRQGAVVERHRFDRDREGNKALSAVRALDLLRRRCPRGELSAIASPHAVRHVSLPCRPVSARCRRGTRRRGGDGPNVTASAPLSAAGRGRGGWHHRCSGPEADGEPRSPRRGDAPMSERPVRSFVAVLLPDRVRAGLAAVSARAPRADAGARLGAGGQSPSHAPVPGRDRAEDAGARPGGGGGRGFGRGAVHGQPRGAGGLSAGTRAARAVGRRRRRGVGARGAPRRARGGAGRAGRSGGEPGLPSPRHAGPGPGPTRGRRAWRACWGRGRRSGRCGWGRST